MKKRRCETSLFVVFHSCTGVDGASMPRSGDLPDELKSLVRLQAVAVSQRLPTTEIKTSQDSTLFSIAVTKSTPGAMLSTSIKIRFEGKRPLSRSCMRPDGLALKKQRVRTMVHFLDRQSPKGSAPRVPESPPQ